MDSTTEIIKAINAYADAQSQQPSDIAWLSLVHRSHHSTAAEEARQIRDAGRDALCVIQDWPTVEQREDGACVLQAPDGQRVLSWTQRMPQRRATQRLTLLLEEGPSHAARREEPPHRRPAHPGAQYLAEVVGRDYDVDGGQHNMRGPAGIVPGIFASVEAALTAARTQANEHCRIRITTRGTRDSDPTVVYEGS